MPNDRTTKKVTLGAQDRKPEVKGGLRRGTMWYWRKLLKEVGIDWTNAENLTRDRKG